MTDSSSSSAPIAVLVVDQNSGVSQRVTLLPDPDCTSFVNLLKALEFQLAPLLNSNNTTQDDGLNQASEEQEFLPLPPESTTLFYLDKEIGTYVPITEPPSLCIGNKTRLMIDFVPPSPAALAARKRQREQLQQEEEASMNNNKNNANSGSILSYSNHNNLSQNETDASSGSYLPAGLRQQQQSQQVETTTVDVDALPPQEESSGSRAGARNPTPPASEDDEDNNTNINNNNNNTSSSSFSPEALLIETAAKLMLELASDSFHKNTSFNANTSSFISSSAFISHNELEQRLSKLPVVVQERAVGAWSRAIAEGFELRKEVKVRAEADSNRTLNAILADRDALLVRLRESKDEVDELKRKLRVQEQAMSLTSEFPSNRVPQQHHQQQEEIALNENAEEEDKQLMESGAVNIMSPQRVENIQQEEDQQEEYINRPESVTPDAGLRGGEKKNQVEEDEEEDFSAHTQRPGTSMGVNNNDNDNVYLVSSSSPNEQDQQEEKRMQGEEDPGKYVREEIACADEEDEDEDQDEEDKHFQSRNDGRGRYQPKTVTAVDVELSPNVSETTSPIHQQQQQPTGRTSSTQQQQPPVPVAVSSKPYTSVLDRKQWAEQQERVPSARPLSATLRKIMTDTSAEQEAVSGSQSVFVSHLPIEEQRRLAHERAVANGEIAADDNSNNNSTSVQYQQPQATRRVGIVYSDPALAHLPGGQRGTKSFIVPDPPSVQQVVEASAKALQVSSVHLAVGYWGSDGMTPVFIKEDAVLHKYLHDQPRVVPFVQCFVISDKTLVGSNSNNNAAAGNVLRPTRPMSAPTAARPNNNNNTNNTSSSAAYGIHASYYQQRHQRLPHNNISHSSIHSASSSSYYNHLPQENISMMNNDETKNSSSSNYYRSTNLAPTVDNTNRKDFRCNVVKNDHSERGLDVLPPRPSEESQSSPWRLRLDCTPPPVHSVNVRKLGVSARQQNQHRTDESIMDTSTNWEPLYRKQQQSSSSRPTSAQLRNQDISTSSSVARGSTTTASNNNSNIASITWGGLGAPKSVQMMGSGVDEDEFDQLYEELCNEAGTDPETEGVPPNTLLRYLDRNFDNLGDLRRFERLIGSYFCRSKLNKNELTLIMLKLAKE